MGPAAAAAEAEAAAAAGFQPSIDARSPPAAVAELAAALVPSWASAGLAPSSLEVRVISGGITNALWSVAVVSSVDVSPRAVAVRAYGDGTELLVDRRLEVATLLELNRRGFGARVVASFAAGRVEEFLPGRALTPDDAARPGMAERIARGLARLHAADLRKNKAGEEGRREARRPRSSCCLSLLFSPRPRATRYGDEDSALFSTMREWIALADRLDAEAAAAEGREKKAKKEPSSSVDSAELLGEVALLEERVRASCSSCASSSSSSCSSSSNGCPELSRVVFCHMDLLPGNIMTTDPDKGGRSPAAADDDEDGEGEEEDEEAEKMGPGRNLQFIDFEYGRPSHAGFDVGNHWCEYAGLDCDWSRYPSREQQRAFAKAYLSEAAAISSKNHRSSSSSAAAAAAAPSLAPPSEERVSAFVAQAELFSLAAHLFWTAWAKVQEHVSPIDFDYGSYARSRFDDFRRRKAAAALAASG